MIKRRPVRFFLLVFALAAAALAVMAHLRLGWNPLVSWLVSANLAALLLWAFDKAQARRGGWRVPEMALHAMAALGAVPASLLAMKVLRHKTLKKHFLLIYGCLLVIHLALAFVILGR